MGRAYIICQRMPLAADKRMAGCRKHSYHSWYWHKQTLEYLYCFVSSSWIKFSYSPPISAALYPECAVHLFYSLLNYVIRQTQTAPFPNPISYPRPFQHYLLLLNLTFYPAPSGSDSFLIKAAAVHTPLTGYLTHHNLNMSVSFHHLLTPHHVVHCVSKLPMLHAL